MSGLIEVTFKILHLPAGSGGRVNKKISLMTMTKMRSSTLVDLSNNDSEKIYCLPIALIVSKCFADNDMSKLRLYKSSRAILMKEVEQFCKRSKVVVGKFGAISDQIFLFHNDLPEYNIIVYDDRDNCESIMYDLKRYDKKPLFLFYCKEEKHYYTLNKTKRFFRMNNQCPFCFNYYNHQHFCSNKCYSCDKNPPCGVHQPTIKCPNCNRKFFNDNCIENHLIKDKSGVNFCMQFYQCTACMKLIDMRRRKESHTCDEKICYNCSSYVPQQHFCFVKPYRKKAPGNYFLIFYDFECTQDLEIAPSQYRHEPNLCVTQFLCKICYNNPIDTPCKNCGIRENIFENTTEGTCTEKFVNYILENRIYTDNVYAIAHNFKGYDSYFVIEELTKRQVYLKPIMCGSKVLKLTLNNSIHFIDSLNFLPMSLAKFTKAFGLKEITKRFYPHWFNTTTNYSYSGPIPDKKYLGVESMNEEIEKNFNVWYDTFTQNNPNYIYVNRDELIKYCKSDVTLLREGCIMFMNEFQHVCSINPFVESFTLAQASQRVFAKNFLKEQSLGIVPNNLYRISGKKQSDVGLKWLICEEKNIDYKIEHEFLLPNLLYYVDGYVVETKTVYEFLGCFFHGCPKCFLNRDAKYFKNG